MTEPQFKERLAKVVERLPEQFRNFVSVYSLEAKKPIGNVPAIDYNEALELAEEMTDELLKPIQAYKKSVLKDNGHYLSSSQVGPTGDPRCPECRNSLQNCTPDGSPHLVRCATCKTVWHFKGESNGVN